MGSLYIQTDLAYHILIIIFIKDKNVGISWNWWTIENQEQNTHNEYQIITDGLETSILRADLEQKWYDSLVVLTKTIDRYPPPVARQKYGNLNESEIFH